MELVWIPGLPGIQALGGWVGKYEVTQEQYMKVMGENPSEFKGNDRLPVEKLSWSNAREFCSRLTDREKQIGRLKGDDSYTLPTAEQWKMFVADALTNATIAVYNASKTAPVGSKGPNQFGLYDVQGNVREWIMPKDNQCQFIGASYNSQVLLTSSWVLVQSSTASRTEPYIGFRCICLASP